ncbi:acyltransferase family protein [Pseudobutyrivibrio sp. LB2011]|uniref:acyltransferase family protein n=1 Tax=Pseudobutyrivibrio sp. LB2011 TaxID=1408312 RepID=UPI0005D19CBD|nr:acyltransferase [Pseudobutyrivibrio sp. LB2011]
MTSKRESWIDIAKIIAIFGVIIDHTNNILYFNQDIAFSSYYSVTLFIFLMGVTTYKSYCNCVTPRKIWNKVWAITYPYLIASFIVFLYYYRMFDFNMYWEQVLTFSADAPYYYVLLYIHLIIVSPILFGLLNYSDNAWKQMIVTVLTACGLVYLASVTTLYTNIKDIYGGGGKLLGGTYIIALFVGMFFEKYKNALTGLKSITKVFLLVVGIVLLILWRNFICIDRFQLDQRFKFGAGLNPPSVSLLIYAFLIFVVVFLLEQVLMAVNLNALNLIWTKVSVLGRHTLYIFLYHKMFRAFIMDNMSFENLWVARIVYFSIMIMGSILIEYIVKTVIGFARKCYGVRQ